MLNLQCHWARFQWTVSIHCMVQCPVVLEWPSVVSYWPCPLSQLSTLDNTYATQKETGCSLHTHYIVTLYCFANNAVGVSWSAASQLSNEKPLTVIKHGSMCPSDIIDPTGCFRTSFWCQTVYVRLKMLLGVINFIMFIGLFLCTAIISVSFAVSDQSLARLRQILAQVHACSCTNTGRIE